MAEVLLTGFEPFDCWPVNSSWEVVRRFAHRQGITVARLPVAHAAAAAAVRSLIARRRPAAALLTGLAPEPLPRLELIGRAGPLAADGGPPARRGRWPFARALARLRARGEPVRLSTDAGGFVCDTTYWAALGTTAPRVVFLHLPPLGPVWTPCRMERIVATMLLAARR